MAEEENNEDKEEENFETSGGDESGSSAEGEEGEEGEAEAEIKAPPLKKVLMFVIPLLILIGGGTGAYMSGLLDGMLGIEEPAEEVPCEMKKEGDPGYEECMAAMDPDMSLQPGAFIKIPDMIVNLKTDDNRPRFLKVALEVELVNETERMKLEPLMPRVIDQFQMYLRELRFEDLKGTSGIYRMKIELLNRIRAVTPGVKVHDILFQEILVQ